MAFHRFAKHWYWTVLCLNVRSFNVTCRFTRPSAATSVPRTPNNEKHDEDEKAVRRFAKDLHALVDEYLEDFTFVSWTALPNAGGWSSTGILTCCMPMTHQCTLYTILLVFVNVSFCLWACVLFLCGFSASNVCDSAWCMWQFVSTCVCLSVCDFSTESQSLCKTICHSMNSNDVIPKGRWTLL